MQCGHMSMCECGCVHAMECVLSEDTFPVSPRLELSWLGSPSKRFYPLVQLLPFPPVILFLLSIYAQVKNQTTSYSCSFDAPLPETSQCEPPATAVTHLLTIFPSPFLIADQNTLYLLFAEKSQEKEHKCCFSLPLPRIYHGIYDLPLLG